MKRLNHILLACFLCVAPLSFVAVESGCTTVYKAASVTQVSVEVAMDVYHDYLQLHPDTSMDLRAKVKKAYESYQVAATTLKDAAIAYNHAVLEKDANLSDFKNAYNVAAAVLAATKLDVLTLIQTAGVKL